MPKKLDPLWEFGELDGGFDRINLSCKLCGRHMSWGFYRLKCYFAQILGRDIGPCTNTNAEIIQRTMRSLEELEQDKVTKAYMKKQLAEKVLGGEYGSGTGSISASMSTTNPVAVSSFFVPRTTPGSQPSITSMLKKMKKNKLRNCWASFSFGVIFLSALQ